LNANTNLPSKENSVYYRTLNNINKVPTIYSNDYSLKIPMFESNGSEYYINSRKLDKSKNIESAIDVLLDLDKK